MTPVGNATRPLAGHRLTSTFGNVPSKETGCESSFLQLARCEIWSLEFEEKTVRFSRPLVQPI